MSFTKVERGRAVQQTELNAFVLQAAQCRTYAHVVVGFLQPKWCTVQIQDDAGLFNQCSLLFSVKIFLRGLILLNFRTSIPVGERSNIRKTGQTTGKRNISSF